MSSLLTVYGTLRFPAGALARWQAAPLPTAEPDAALTGDGVFANASDVASVAELLADQDDCHVFVRFIVDGDTLHVRAALGDDDWCRWCGRIRAAVQAAAALGARGELDTEDDGSYAGTLVAAGPRAKYQPAGPRRRAGRQEAAHRDTWRIFEEVLAADRARRASKTPSATRKATAKPTPKQPIAKPTAKTTAKPTANKTTAKTTAKPTAKQTTPKTTANKPTAKPTTKPAARKRA